MKFLETREPGYCEASDGSRQNSGKIQKYGPNYELLADINTAYLENLCLKECREQPGATGCEIVWGRDTRGCYAHTKEVARGSGAQKGYQHMCWIFNTIGASQFGLGEFIEHKIIVHQYSIKTRATLLIISLVFSLSYRSNK